MNKITKKQLIKLMNSNILQIDKNKISENMDIEYILNIFLETFELTVAQQLREGNEVVLNGFLKFIMYRRSKTKLNKFKLIKEASDVCKCRVSPSYTKRILRGRD